MFEGDEEPTKQIQFEIEVDGEEKIWTVNESNQRDSLMGQIITFANEHCGGDLEGETLTLKRIGTGKTDTSYIVKEVV